MRSFEKDYEYLLLHLVPHHRLSPARRRAIGNVILSGRDAAVRRLGILILEDLCRSGDFRRTSVESEGSEIVVTYARSSGSYEIKLHLPSGEWDPVSLERDPELQEAADQPTPVTSIEILPNLLKSLSINDRRESTIERLESVIALMPQWLSLITGRLVLVEERVGRPVSGGSHVAGFPESVLIRRAVYERVRRSGRTETVGWEAAIALGIPEPILPVSATAGGNISVAISPVFALGEFWGIMEIWASDTRDRTILESRVKVAVGMVGQIIENSIRLESLTSVDKLTSLYNRHFYDRQVRVEIERSTRSGGKLSLLIVDIDDFKQVNDTYGHRVGDEALGMVAQHIKGNLRKIDLAFRYGGEEFVVLLPGTARIEAIHTAERLRTVIAGAGDVKQVLGRTRPITVSIGGAVFPDDAGDEEELFSKADEALYRAKGKGKNRVEFFEE